MKYFTIILLVIILSAPVSSLEAAVTKTSAQKKEMIRKSIASYNGSCPCPYNTMKNGRSCGKNSAWSKPGGKQPLCYESDIK